KLNVLRRRTRIDIKAQRRSPVGNHPQALHIGEHQVIRTSRHAHTHIIEFLHSDVLKREPTLAANVDHLQPARAGHDWNNAPLTRISNDGIRSARRIHIQVWPHHTPVVLTHDRVLAPRSIGLLAPVHFAELHYVHGSRSKW